MPEEFVLKTRFVHLLPAEKALWEKWLSRYQDAWERYEYDVHIGEGVTYESPEAVWIKDLAKLLTQKRIDVMAWRQGIPWIFEIKPQAGLSGYGQLLAYRELYLRENPGLVRVELAIVTDLLNPDEDFLYRSAGINVFLV